MMPQLMAQRLQVQHLDRPIVSPASFALDDFVMTGYFLFCMQCVDINKVE